MKLTKTQKILLGTAITGIGGYFLYKYFFPTEEDVNTGSGGTGGGGTGGGGTGGGGTGGGGTGGGGTGTGLVVLPGNTGVVPLPVVIPPTIIPFKIGDKIYSNQDSPIKAYSDVNRSIYLKEFYKGEYIGEIVFLTPFSKYYQIKKTNGTFYAPLPDTFFYVDSNKGYKK
jgi:hypothetical protein